MKFMESTSNSFSKWLGKQSLRVDKHSPELLVGVGIISTLGAAVLACRATLKVDVVMTNHQDKMTRIKDGRDQLGIEEYSDKAYKQDMTVTCVQTGVDLVKLYAPAVILGVAGISCIVGGHTILHRRNFALVAAYKAVEEGFNAYRKRVVEDFGADRDFMYRNGLRSEKVEVEEIDEETGKKKKVTKEVLTKSDDGYSIYARFFDESSVNWCKDPINNLAFVRGVEKMCNDILHSKGHIFLNNAYEMLGLETSAAGQFVGWALDGNGDGTVDFGIYEPNNQRFINGFEQVVLLDFNVDGRIHDIVFRNEGSERHRIG